MKLAEVFRNATKGPAVIRGPSSGRMRGMDDGGDFAVVVNGDIIGEAFRRLGTNNYADAEANAILFKLAVNHFEAMKEALEKAIDTIQWMSGSSDFSPGGQAHQGWLKARNDMNAMCAVLAAIDKDAES